MMKYFLLILLFATSCESGKKKIDFSGMAQLTADIECRAISIREKRFKLANEIRFTQDTLLLTKNTDSLRLKLNLARLNGDKEVVMSQSQLMADSIKNLIDSLSKNFLTDPASKKQFNDSLNLILAMKGCLNTP